MDTLLLTHSDQRNADHARNSFVQFADHASRVDGHCIGWLPFKAYQGAYDASRVIQLYRNADRVGFLIWSVNTYLECRILQIWVRHDARLILHGRALVDELERKVARPHNCWIIRLWCADDLEANLFWPALCFSYRGWRWGRGETPRKHLLWARPVTTTLVPQRHPTYSQQQDEHEQPNPELVRWAEAAEVCKVLRSH